MKIKVRIDKDEYEFFDAKVFNVVGNGSLHIFENKSSVDAPMAIFPAGGWLGAWDYKEPKEEPKQTKKK